jgi:ubiquinone/menaquinone biosynthesis C-methylase UbiE
MFTDPRAVLNQLGVTPGMKVAECGAGSGFYTIPLARMVGEKGRVYVVDIQASLLDRIKTTARREGLNNLDYIHGDLEAAKGTHLADNGCDAALVSNVLFQVDNKPAVVSEVWRIVKPQGHVAVIDWTDSFSGMGPSAQHVVTEEAAKKLFESKGFSYSHKITVGDHHWGALFVKQGSGSHLSHL